MVSVEVLHSRIEQCQWIVATSVVKQWLSSQATAAGTGSFVKRSRTALYPTCCGWLHPVEASVFVAPANIASIAC
jgi:hypothetical protein